MAIKNHQEVFHELRKDFPFLTFQKYTFITTEKGYEISFLFNLSDKYFFQPVIQIPYKHFFTSTPDETLLHQLAFHIGMVELISYWKAACPPLIIVQPFQLSNKQLQWWKKLYFLGLGEFFYTNGINTDFQSFTDIITDSNKHLIPINPELGDDVIVPVGGGKDSVVSLELLLQNNFTIRPMIVNPREASKHCALIAGFDEKETIIVHRSIDPQLLELNANGFLNGHTPFSALLAFIGAFTAVLNNSRFIALSNESSANEPTVPDTNINHQYSKSLEFEKDFSSYLHQNITESIQYFSLLRPLNELQIAAFFSRQTAYHAVFKSCNAGSKTDSWCGKCPKCLFTFIMLSPFMKAHQMEAIFRKNLLDDATLLAVLNELAGISPIKPFECVGTTEEVSTALQYLAADSATAENALLKMFTQTAKLMDTNQLFKQLNHLLKTFDSNHCLEPKFEKIVQQLIHDLPHH